jgi:hypothetical protein
MTTTWTIGVLPPLVENVIELGPGHAPTFAAAYAAASAALLAAVAGGRRQEYRLRVDDLEMTITSGLTADGALDLQSLREALCRCGDRDVVQT